MFGERQNLHPGVLPSRNISVDLGGNFAVAALSLYYAGQSDEVIQFCSS